MEKVRFLLVNGPNLNLLGRRETALYGAVTLAEIEQLVAKQAEDLGGSVECFQSNAEYALIDRIHRASIERVDYILINPAAFTHTSVALRDALLAVAIPFTEIHLTDPLQRESFRHNSYFSDIAVEVVKGMGAAGYVTATKHAVAWLKNSQSYKND